MAKVPSVISLRRRGVEESLNPRSWYMKMKDIPCFMIGNGPSVRKLDLKILDDYFTVGINRIFYIYDPTILIWQDLALWTQEKKKVMKTKAIKYCRSGSQSGGNKDFYYFKLEGREPQLTHDLKKLYGRGSSGTITYQFVWALGCNPIILVGRDCKYDSKGRTDFYGTNPMHRRHTLPFCKKGLKFMKKHACGRTLINCSKNSVFSSEETKTIKEVVDSLKDKKSSRKELVKRLLKGD